MAFGFSRGVQFKQPEEPISGVEGDRWYDTANSQLKIFPGQWFGWHFLTHPEVEIIYFNSTLDSATVHFRIVFEGGEARFAKNNDKWEMHESKLTWIE